MTICGIDPGLSGGIAFMVDGALGQVHRMPETERDVFELLSKYHIDRCYIESVHSFPGQGVASSFTFGKGYGFLRGCLVALKIPFVDVSPMKWKKALGITFTAQDSKKDKKNGSKALCQQWFPAVKINHAISEAILIAEYGRRIESGGTAALAEIRRLEVLR